MRWCMVHRTRSSTCTMALLQVTVDINTTAQGFNGALSLQEVTPLYDGGWLMQEGGLFVMAPNPQADNRLVVQLS